MLRRTDNRRTTLRKKVKPAYLLERADVGSITTEYALKSSTTIAGFKATHSVNAALFAAPPPSSPPPFLASRDLVMHACMFSGRLHLLDEMACMPSCIGGHAESLTSRRAQNKRVGGSKWDVLSTNHVGNDSVRRCVFFFWFVVTSGMFIDCEGCC